MSALLLPPTDRLLRGVQQALAEMEVAGRPDLKHAIAGAQLVLSHLLARQDLSACAANYADILRVAREGASRFALNVMAAIDALPQQLAAGENYDAVQVQIARALEVLREVVATAGRGSAPSADPFFQQALMAEAGFYAGTMPAPVEGPEAPPPLTREGFDAYLATKFPGRFKGVTAFQKLVGGFQKETIVFDAELPDGTIQSMVIRAEKHDRFVRFTASEVTDEYEIVRVMWDKGMSVAEPLWLEADDSLLGRRFMVSTRARGGNAASATPGASSFAWPAEVTQALLTAMAQLHNLPLDAAVAETKLGTWLRHKTLADNTRAEVAMWRNQIWLDDKAPPSPGFDRLFDWLEANVPEDDFAPCIVHNDFGPHNILSEGDAVTAVLDWEIARIGDPAEDLSFFLQCAGPIAVDHEAVIATYGEMSGKPITRFRLKYFDVLSCAKVIVSTRSATSMYQGTEPALIDWVQMPVLWHGGFLPQIEAKIAAAEAARGQ